MKQYSIIHSLKLYPQGNYDFTSYFTYNQIIFQTNGNRRWSVVPGHEVWQPDAAENQQDPD